jgi:hypothetical protein
MGSTVALPHENGMRMYLIARCWCFGNVPTVQTLRPFTSRRPPVLHAPFMFPALRSGRMHGGCFFA